MNDVPPLLAVAVMPEHGTELTVVIRGEVDLATAAQLADNLMQAIDAHQPQHVTLDTEAMTFLDAAGMAALISVYQRAKLRHVKIRMEKVQPSVMRPLRVVDLVTFLDASE